MQYLVDAYNLLFRSTKKRGPLEQTRQQLIEELNEAVSKLNLQVILVFDGADKHFSHASRGHFNAVEVIYTPQGQTADEYISEEVIQSLKPAQITVVTNDRELAHRCKAHRAKILTLDQFISFLMKKKIKKRKTSSSARNFRDSEIELNRLLLIFEKKMLEDLTKELD